jgi:hypothetical protein
MTAEQELLLRCAAPPRPDTESSIADVLAGGAVNWPAFVELSARQGLISIVYRQLWTLFSDIIPEEIMERLRSLHSVNNAKNFYYIRELEAVLLHMKSRGIPALAFKGPALAAQLYGDARLRTSSDIDILVRRHDVREATEALLALGYHPELPLSGIRGVFYLFTHNELTMMSDDRAPLEIQWGLGPWHYGCQWDLSDAFSFDCTVKAGDTIFPTLPPEELLLALTVHGTKHLWEKLLWLCDVAWLVSVTKELDWDRIISISSAVGCRRMLFLGLQLARDLFGVELPHGVDRAIQSERGLGRLANEVRANLFVEGNEPALLYKKMLFFIRTRERRQDRVLFAVKTLMNGFAVAVKPINLRRPIMPLCLIRGLFPWPQSAGHLFSPKLPTGMDPDSYPTMKPLPRPSSTSGCTAGPSSTP